MTTHSDATTLNNNTNTLSSYYFPTSSCNFSCDQQENEELCGYDVSEIILDDDDISMSSQPYPLSPLTINHENQEECDILMTEFGNDWNSSHFQPISQEGERSDNDDDDDYFDEDEDDLKSFTSMIDSSISRDIFESSSSCSLPIPIVQKASAPTRTSRPASPTPPATPTIEFVPATTTAFTPYSSNNSRQQPQSHVVSSSGLVSLGSYEEEECSMAAASIDGGGVYRVSSKGTPWVPLSVTCPVVIVN